MPNAVPDDLAGRVRDIIRQEMERIGIYATEARDLKTTRRDIDALHRIAPRADDLINLLDEDEDRKRAARETERADEEDRRERKNHRYEAAMTFLSGIAQYGAAGLIGYGVSWILTHFRGHQ